MTLDQLRYFVAAAKFQHIHRAAHSIPISVSTVSQSVRDLEDELNCKLFDRDGKKMRLTQDGVRLLELSEDLIGRADGIKQTLGQNNLPLSGHYRIGASHFLATKVVTPVWTKLQSQFRHLNCEISSQPTWVLVDSILSGRIDFGVGFSPVPHPQLDTEEIFRGNSEIVVRKNHPIFSQAKSHHYKLLRDYPATMHIATEKITSSRNHPVLKALNIEMDINFEFDSDFVAIENLKSSDNWSFMLDIVAVEFKKYVRTVPVPRKSEAQYTIQIIKHKSRKVDAPMAEAFRLIKEYAHGMNRIE